MDDNVIFIVIPKFIINVIDHWQLRKGAALLCLPINQAGGGAKFTGGPTKMIRGRGHR